jgi:hypothetical protein
MSCEDMQERISSLLDRQVAAGEEESLLAHIKSCHDCSARFESYQNMRASLGRMAPRAVPDGLTAKLRVLASHERERRLSRVSLATRIKHMAEWAELHFDNMMRPLALPFAGGLVSAMLSFCMLVPILSFPHNFVGGPTFFVEPAGKLVDVNGQVTESIGGPFIHPVNAPFSDYANVVDLTIDENGKVVDWSVVKGTLTDELKYILMLSRFTPATTFGQPTSGKVRFVQDLIVQGAPYSFTVRG